MITTTNPEHEHESIIKARFEKEFSERCPNFEVQYGDPHTSQLAKAIKTSAYKAYLREHRRFENEKRKINEFTESLKGKLSRESEETLSRVRMLSYRLQHGLPVL